VLRQQDVPLLFEHIEEPKVALDRLEKVSTEPRGKGYLLRGVYVGKLKGL